MRYFFAGCFTPAEIKARYRQLAKKYHPDLPTGDAELFKSMLAEYELVNSGKVVPQPPKVWGKTKRRNRISKLVLIQQEKSFKKLWVYHAFLKDLQESGQKITRTDLEFIAFKLDYQKGWIEIMVKENKID